MQDNSSSLVQAFLMMLRRDLLLASRRRGEMANPILFFVLVVSLFPLGIGNKPAILQSIAPGLIWVAALLSAMLSLDSIFRYDFEDGTLERWLLSPHPTAILVLAKILAHWIVTGLPLMVVSPALALLLGIPAHAIIILMFTLLLGTPVLSCIGAIGMALTVGLRRGGIILSLLILPLYIPVLIFASSAVERTVLGLHSNAPLYMLGSLFILALSLSPWPTAAALRLSVS